MFDWFSHFFKKKHSDVYKTVRYAFPLFFVTAILAGLAAVATQDASYVSISTDIDTLKEGEYFFINVNVFAHLPINAIDIVVKYPKDQITVEGIDTGTSVITLWAEEPYAKDGNIYLRGGVFQKGFTGDHTVARIRAKATQTGIAHVSANTATFIAGDGKGTSVDVYDNGKNEARMYIEPVDGTLSAEAVVSIITDLDGDGAVGLSDISAFMGAWFTRGKTFDFNNDGRMTFTDFSILLADSFRR